jgi:hypothetical protein
MPLSRKNIFDEVQKSLTEAGKSASTEKINSLVNELVQVERVSLESITKAMQNSAFGRQLINESVDTTDANYWIQIIYQGLKEKNV